MKLKNGAILFLCALIWGTAFVAQSAGMEHVGPFTFLFLRSILGGLFLIPIAIVTHKIGNKASKVDKVNQAKDTKMLIRAGLTCGLIYFCASGLQQVSLLNTSVGKAGFLTTCYILIVPVLSFIIWRKKSSATVLAGIIIAVAGLYFLSIQESFFIEPSDLICLAGAAMFAAHIVAIDYFVLRAESVKISCLQFWVAAIPAGIFMLLFETPTIEGIMAASGTIAYTGIMSSGVAFTLQMIGQKGMNPTIASMIMSLEAVISVFAGWLILREVLSSREIFGCVLMFVAIIVAQLPEKKKAPTSGMTI